MHRESFEQLAELLKDDAVFYTLPKRMQQAPVQYQLAVALTRFGSFGNGASVGKIARMFSISGTLSCVLFALRSALTSLPTSEGCTIL